MTRRDPFRNFSKKDKLLYFWDGDVLIKDDISEAEYQEFKKIKEDSIKYSRYTILHGWLESILVPRGIFCYYIPKDIFKYLIYKNGIILENKEVPEKLMDKFLVCKRVMEVDFALFKNSIFIGGRKIGLKSSWRFGNPIIFIKKSENNRLSLSTSYKDISEKDYIKNFDKHQAQKQFYLEHGYRE